MTKVSFGEWLKRQRNSRGLTQEQLAHQIGCATITLRKIEAEERRPSAEIVDQLIRILEIPQGEKNDFLKFARGDWTKAPGEDSEELPWRSPRSTRTNLPASVTPLIGRERSLAEIQDYLLRAEIRLVTLIGPPGIGKTRLSIEAARQSLSDFADGVFFVGLATLDDPKLISATVRQVLGYVEDPKITPEQQLIQSLGEKQMLIVLDNCEHLVADAATFASGLLSACSNLKILATSRESLHIPGEWLYTVPPLELPEEISQADINSISEYPALTLFAQRARAVRNDFSLTADNIQAVSAICAGLDGLPLAIELIAARVRLMSPQALLERWSGQFVLTADGMHPTSERQKTLKNAIHWSYDLLSEEEQRLFACLSVFSGSFTLEAAEAMFSSRITKKPVSDLIALLFDKSLLQPFPNENGEPRYTMLVTIREFARERLRSMGQEGEIRNLHLEYFLALGEQADQEIHGPNQVGLINFVEAESNNFRAALEWSVSNHDAESALRLLCAISWPWRLRGHYEEARSWFEKIRAMPNASDYPAIYARLLSDMGHHSWTSEDNLRDAYSLLNESQQISLRLGVDGEQGLAETLNRMGLVMANQGDLHQAKSMFEHALELNKKWDNQREIALTSLHLGIIENDLDHPEQALSWLEVSLSLFRQFEDLFFIARVSGNLGDLFLGQGDHDRARRLYEQDLEIDEELQYWGGIGIAYTRLGKLYLHQGDYDQAEQYFEKAQAIGREHGRYVGDTDMLYRWSLVALHQNNYSIARARFLDYFEIARKKHEKVSVCDLLVGFAAIAAGTNQPERAAKLYGAAQVLFETTDYRHPAFERDEFNRHMQMAQEQLGGAKFEQLMSEGYAMTMEQAIQYALSEQSD